MKKTSEKSLIFQLLFPKENLRKIIKQVFLSRIMNQRDLAFWKVQQNLREQNSWGRGRTEMRAKKEIS